MNTLEVRGKVLDPNLGIYAIRVFNLEKKKDIQAIGPDSIEFSKEK